MGLFDWIRGERGNARGADAARVDESLERIVRVTNPRLTFARRYRARLTPALETAMEYARSLVAAVPAGREASAAAWRSDPTVRALFATADDLARTFSRSPELRAWFDTNAVQEVHAVLSMLLVERRILGVSLEGGVVQRDVPQTTASFEDHRVRICARSEPELRSEIERRLVDQLALTGLAMATQDQSRHDVLEQENALLRTRLRLLQGQGVGLSGLAGKPAPGSVVERVQAELAMNEANLRTIATGPEGLDYELERLCEALANPREHLFVNGRRLRLSRMNVEMSEDSADPGETLDLQVARIPIPDGPPEMRTFVIVRFQRSDLLPRAALLDDAARML